MKSWIEPKRWYVITKIDGVTHVIQDVDNKGWIEWVKLDCFASPFYFSTFAAAFSCCGCADDVVLEVPLGGIEVQP